MRKEGAISTFWEVVWVVLVLLVITVVTIPNCFGNHEKSHWREDLIKEKQDSLMADTREGRAAAVDTVLKAIEEIKQQIQKITKEGMDEDSTR